MGTGELLEPYELHYSDLVVLSADEASSSSSSLSSSEQIERLEAITRDVLENLGPRGPGLVAITGVPKAFDLRRSLLPLAGKLALISNEDCKRILKLHNLGSDVPLKNLDRNVSSFAMQLKYEHDTGNPSAETTHSQFGENSAQDYAHAPKLGEFQDGEFANLSDFFRELGFCMMEIGHHLARVCDKVIGGHELEQSLLESCTAKGRLIHYHSALDNLILKEADRRKRSSKRQANIRYSCNGMETEQSVANGLTNSRGHKAKPCRNQSNLWQQWHYDYGIFTILTAPMFMMQCHPQRSRNDFSCNAGEQECPSPSGHSYLQIFDPNKNGILLVKASPESFIVQVGESADILSKGRLRSTLHSVGRPYNLENLSRETFVVFLQPAWSKTFALSDYPPKHLAPDGLHAGICTERSLKKPTQEIHEMVPPLSQRLKDGMSFAEFARETTKQYYGGSGLQSKR